MKFRVWLEDIDRGDAQDIILDALGASSSDEESRRKVLTGRVGQYPELPQTLEKYAKLRSYLAEIQSWIARNAESSITELITEIDRLDGIEKSKGGETPVEFSPLGNSAPDSEELGPEL